jgi:hypothetical protein
VGGAPGGPPAPAGPPPRPIPRKRCMAWFDISVNSCLLMGLERSRPPASNMRRMGLFWSSSGSSCPFPFRSSRLKKSSGLKPPRPPNPPPGGPPGPCAWAREAPQAIQIAHAAQNESLSTCIVEASDTWRSERCYYVQRMVLTVRGANQRIASVLVASVLAVSVPFSTLSTETHERFRANRDRSQSRLPCPQFQPPSGRQVSSPGSVNWKFVWLEQVF